MPEWRIQHFRNKLALVFEHEGKRQRHTLGTADKSEAERLAPALYAELTRPKGNTVSELWQGYITAKDGRAVLATMKHTWKALKTRFGPIPGPDITLADCRAHVEQRANAGIKPGTIHTELGHLRMVLLWAEGEKLIPRAPKIERPSKPEPKTHYLTRDEAAHMIAVAEEAHIKRALHLLLATAGRVQAVLDLKWDRVDFERRQIHLRDPSDMTRRKGRATVPMTDTLYAVLKPAKEAALSAYVIEWGGRKVGSLKRGIKTAATRAGLENVSPHVFRHTAAVWMAEGGVPMSEIAQYLGHSNTRMTEVVYARFSPDHLRKAAANLEIGFNVVPASSSEPSKRNRA